MVSEPSSLVCRSNMEASTSTWMVSLNGNNWLIWKYKREDLHYFRDLNVLIFVDKKPYTMSNED